MSFFSLCVAARELSLGEGATAELEDDGKRCAEAEEEEDEAARLEVDEVGREVVWRVFEARLLLSPF